LWKLRKKSSDLCDAEFWWWGGDVSRLNGVVVKDERYFDRMEEKQRIW
jgi:hypothetical protein